jgi:hypothetical protein
MARSGKIPSIPNRPGCDGPSRLPACGVRPLGLPKRLGGRSVGLHPDDAVGGDVCPALEGLGRRLGLRPEDAVGRDLGLARLACVGQLADRRLLVTYRRPPAAFMQDLAAHTAAS